MKECAFRTDAAGRTDGQPSPRQDDGSPAGFAWLPSGVLATVPNGWILLSASQVVNTGLWIR